MPWPTLADYKATLQHPAACFTDADLRVGSPRTDRFGLPTGISGGFAVVYPFTCGGMRWAVRCFSRDVADRTRRYAEISSHLAKVRPPSLANFQFLAQGINIQGRWFPILKMEWIEGRTLNSHVEGALGDRSSLLQLAVHWQRLQQELKASGIAHGDLQHGNVLVAQSRLRLVDYDGMYVPALRGLASNEIGHPSYQHPRRSNADYGPHIDRFSALVIYVALLALAEAPTLWARFNTGENMLFQKMDFKDSKASPVFSAIRNLKGGDLQGHISALEQACNGTVSTVPELQGAGSVTPAPAPTPGVPLDLGDGSFDAMVGASKTPVVVEFWAEWCRGSLYMRPIIEDLARHYGARVVLARIDVDANPVTPARYQVLAIPAVLVFRSGKLVGRMTAAPKDDLQRGIEAALRT